MGSPRPEQYRTVSEPIADTAPCIGCGLCCDGTLYSMARAEPEEEERILAFGLTLLDNGDKRYFAQPCPHSADGKCGIYEKRFTKCRTFTCKLLKAYQAGEIDIQTASEKVATAKKLRDAVIAEDRSAALIEERIRIRREGDALKRSRKLLLNMATLDYYLDGHFRNKDPQFVRSDEATDRA